MIISEREREREKEREREREREREETFLKETSNRWRRTFI
jgi:hypothetical protein